MRHQGERDADKEEWGVLSHTPAALELCLDSVFKVRFSSHFNRNEGLIQFKNFLKGNKHSLKNQWSAVNRHIGLKRKKKLNQSQVICSSFLPTEVKKGMMSCERRKMH